MSDNRLGIAVVMYHTVGRKMPDWKWSFLTVPADIFEDHLRWLVQEGYTTVGLNDLYRHVAGELVLPCRSVVLTFDDGYLDNWTYVAPLLRKYGCMGTVFVNPDFVDPEEAVRPTLDDVWAGKCREEDLPVRGFMSWPELLTLADHGPLKVEAHAMSHTWYPTSHEIVDFHHPDDDYYWLDWNAFPEQKPFYLREPQKSAVLFGTPVYEHQKSLAATRYFPDPDEEKGLVDFVARHGGEAFFAEQHWRQKLVEQVQKMRLRKESSGRYETDEEQQARYGFELGGTRKVFAEKLGRPTDFLCWPGGGYNERSQILALQEYRAVTLGSADSSPVRNRPGDDPQLIKRMGVPSIACHGQIIYPGGRYLVQALKEYQNNLFARKYRQVLKTLVLLRGLIVG
jgi:hypothetical protein